MIKFVIFTAFSFMLGLFARDIIEIIENQKRLYKLKPLSKQDFEKAMKELEIK